jgi:hypothetical protein
MKERQYDQVDVDIFCSNSSCHLTSRELKTANAFLYDFSLALPEAVRHERDISNAER